MNECTLFNFTLTKIDEHCEVKGRKFSWSEWGNMSYSWWGNSFVDWLIAIMSYYWYFCLTTIWGWHQKNALMFSSANTNWCSGCPRLTLDRMQQKNSGQSLQFWMQVRLSLRHGAKSVEKNSKILANFGIASENIIYIDQMPNEVKHQIQQLAAMAVVLEYLLTMWLLRRIHPH